MSNSRLSLRERMRTFAERKATLKRGRIMMGGSRVRWIESEGNGRRPRTKPVSHRAIVTWIALLGALAVSSSSTDPLVCSPLRADEPDWEMLIQRPILPRHIPESEVRAYCAQRVASLP